MTLHKRFWAWLNSDLTIYLNRRDDGVWYEKASDTLKVAIADLIELIVALIFFAVIGGIGYLLFR